jgi:hypothetical protein
MSTVEVQPACPASPELRNREFSMIRKTAFAVLSLAFAAVASSATPQRLEAQDTFTCESRNNDRTYCNVNTRGNVHLVRQLSQADCVAGRSWGTDSRGVWVSRGCRANFVINNNPATRAENRVNGGMRRNENRATRATSNQAVRICRDATRDRYRNLQNRDVSTSYQGTDRSGNYLVRWNTPRAAGTCSVDQNGRLVNLRVTRR